MKRLPHSAFISALLSFPALLAVAGPSLPEGFNEEKLRQVVKAVAPPSFDVRFIAIKASAMRGDTGEARGTLTANLTEDLYEDAGADLLGSEVGGVARPTVLRKIHRNREILELPIRFSFAKVSGEWTIHEWATQPSFQALGAPLGDFPSGAVIAGTTQGDAAVRAYQTAAKKASAARNAPASVSTSSEERAAKSREEAKEREEARRAATEKKAQDAKQAAEEKSEAARAEAQRDLETLQTACTPPRRYTGTITDRDGAHEVDLVFNRIERAGDLVCAELLDRNSSMRRKPLSGAIRANKLLATHYEVVLVGVSDGSTRSALTRSSQTKASGIQTTLILTPDREGNLVGNYSFRTFVAGQTTSTFRPTPLTNQETFSIRFRPSL